jgi:N,N'-diacetyllegionaminate synthase
MGERSNSSASVDDASVASIVVGSRRVGIGAPAFIIGEVAQAHDGSLGFAHAFIDAIADAGADAVKFQTHIATAESTLDEPFRVPFSYEDSTRFDYWRRMEFTEDQWGGLRAHASQRGLVFMSTPFSEEAVAMLSRVGQDAWKVASGEVGNHALLEAILTTGKPLMISSGLSTLQELTDTVDLVRTRGGDLAIFQCTTAYPTAPEEVGLNLITELRDRFRVPVGLSDHTGTIYPSLAAVTLGASLIEVHVTLSRYAFGPDVTSSVTVPELKQLVQGARLIETILAHPMDKDESSTSRIHVRKVFGRSIAPRTIITEGTVITKEMLTLKKPAGGLAPARLCDVVGCTAARDLLPERLILATDLVPPLNSVE